MTLPIFFPASVSMGSTAGGAKLTPYDNCDGSDLLAEPKIVSRKTSVIPKILELIVAVHTFIRTVIVWYWQVRLTYANIHDIYIDIA